MKRRKAKRERTEKTGPSMCMRSTRIAAPCWTCGAIPDVAHSPLRHRGIFCGACCIECNPHGLGVSERDIPAGEAA